MTLERFIGYSGLLLILINALPFSRTFVMIISIILGVCYILVATYLRWKHKISRYLHSHQGTMSVPHLFSRLESEGKMLKNKKNNYKIGL